MAATSAGLAVWTALAAMRPEVTYHLAPAMVVWLPPWTYAGAPRPARLAAVAAGLIAAVGAAAVLRAAGWLAGPVLFGRDALDEAVLVALGAAAVAVVAATPRGRASERSRTTGPR